MGKIDRDIEERDPERSVGFAASPVLPGEDPKEFQCLVDELSEQYQPMGPLEKDAVQTMARAVFRKRHLDIFQRAFEARMKWGSFFKFSGDTEGLNRITEQIHQHLTAMHTETTTKYAIQMVEGELAKFATDGTEKAKLIPDEADIADEVADTSAEEFVKGIVKTAISEIKIKKHRV